MGKMGINLNTYTIDLQSSANTLAKAFAEGLLIKAMSGTAKFNLGMVGLIATRQKGDDNLVSLDSLGNAPGSLADKCRAQGGRPINDLHESIRKRWTAGRGLSAGFAISPFHGSVVSDVYEVRSLLADLLYSKIIDGVLHLGLRLSCLGLSIDDVIVEGGPSFMKKLRRSPGTITPGNQPASIDGVLDYLSHLDSFLARSPLLDRLGIRLDQVRIPLQVVPYEPSRDIEEIQTREHFRQFNTAHNDRNTRERIWSFRGSMMGNSSDAVPESLSELEPRLHRAIILGDPGCGKTEWLKQTARSYTLRMKKAVEHRPVALSDNTLPLFARLPDIARELSDDRRLADLVSSSSMPQVAPVMLSDAERFAAALIATLIRSCPAVRKLSGMLWSSLSANNHNSYDSKRFAIFLDALDEVRIDRDLLTKCLTAFAQASSIRMIITSRIAGYVAQPLTNNGTSSYHPSEFQICPFKPKDTDTFVRRIFKDRPSLASAMLADLAHKPSVAGMAQNPLLATLLCKSFAPDRTSTPANLPSRRVDVYARVLRGLLGDWRSMDKQDAVVPDLVAAKIRILEDIAYHFFPNEIIATEQLNDLLWADKHGLMAQLDPLHPLKRRMHASGAEGLPDELSADGLFIPIGDSPTDYTFLHLTLQEYLTACALRRQENWMDIVDRHMFDPVWMEPLTLVAGVIGTESIPYLAHILNRNSEDIAFRPIELATRCTLEIEPSRLPPGFEHDFYQCIFQAFIHHGLWPTTSLFQELMCIWGPRSFPFILQNSASMDEKTKTNAIELLIKMGDPGVEMLISLMGGTDKKTCLIAKKALLHIPNHATIPILLEMMDQNNIVTRKYASYVFGQIGEAALPYLANALKMRDVRAQQRALDMLTHMMTPSVLPLVIPILKNAKKLPTNMLCTAICVAGISGTSAAVLHLKPFLHHDDADIRDSAIYALGINGSAAAAEALLPLLRHVDPKGLASIIRSLGHTKLSDLAPAVASYVQHPDPNVRSTVLYALCESHAKDQLGNIIPLLQDDAPTVRTAAATALDELKAPGIIELLTPLLQDDDPTVRNVALSIQAKEGTRVLPTAVKFLKDKDVYVRRTAVHIVGNLGSQADIQRLTPLLDDADLLTAHVTGIAIATIGKRTNPPVPWTVIPYTMRHEMESFTMKLEELARTLLKCSSR